MNGARNQNRNQDSGGLLKTTTWGTLIASAILAAWGLTGNFVTSNSQQVQEPPVLTASNDSYQAPQAHASDPYRSEAQGNLHASPRPSSASSSLVVSVGAQNGSRIPLASASNALPSKASDNKPRPAERKLPTDNDDPQRAIAAKIAPDLKGIKPDAAVDVIVQFRH